MSRPCIFRGKDREPNRNNDERRTRQNQERNADQQNRGSNNGDDDSPDALDILKIPKTQNPFDPVHVRDRLFRSAFYRATTLDQFDLQGN